MLGESYMKYEDRIQVKMMDLTETFFRDIVAYNLIRPSGLGGPSCVIMISDKGKVYQLQGYELDVLNFYSGWQQAIPVLQKFVGKDGYLHYEDEKEISEWKSIIVLGGTLIIRLDFYPKYMECRETLGDPIQFKSGFFTEAVCLKAVLLQKAKTIQEKERINRKYEFRKPLFKKGDLVSFIFSDEIHQWPCKGMIEGVDIYYNIEGKIENIKYDIKGTDYINHKKKRHYKHIEESLIKEASGSIWLVSGYISDLEKRQLETMLQEQYSEEYVILNRSVIDSEICNLCFKGKKVLLLIEPHEIIQIKRYKLNILRLCLEHCMRKYIIWILPNMM